MAPADACRQAAGQQPQHYLICASAGKTSIAGLSGLLHPHIYANVGASTPRPPRRQQR
jgi:hypothetical protein